MNIRQPVQINVGRKVKTLALFIRLHAWPRISQYFHETQNTARSLGAKGFEMTANKRDSFSIKLRKNVESDLLICV